jgi:hypothetical protein
MTLIHNQMPEQSITHFLNKISFLYSNIKLDANNFEFMIIQGSLCYNLCLYY